MKENLPIEITPGCVYRNQRGVLLVFQWFKVMMNKENLEVDIVCYFKRYAGKEQTGESYLGILVLAEGNPQYEYVGKLKPRWKRLFSKKIYDEIQGD